MVGYQSKKSKERQRDTADKLLKIRIAVEGQASKLDATRQGRLYQAIRSFQNASPEEAAMPLVANVLAQYDVDFHELEALRKINENREELGEAKRFRNRRKERTVMTPEEHEEALQEAFQQGQHEKQVEWERYMVDFKKFLRQEYETGKEHGDADAQEEMETELGRCRQLDATMAEQNRRQASNEMRESLAMEIRRKEEAWAKTEKKLQNPNQQTYRRSQYQRLNAQSNQRENSKAGNKAQRRAQEIRPRSR